MHSRLAFIDNVFAYLCECVCVCVCVRIKFLSFFWCRCCCCFGRNSLLQCMSAVVAAVAAIHFHLWNGCVFCELAFSYQKSLRLNGTILQHTRSFVHYHWSSLISDRTQFNKKNYEEWVWNFIVIKKFFWAQFHSVAEVDSCVWEEIRNLKRTHTQELKKDTNDDFRVVDTETI